jgi:allantoinase
MDSGTSAAAAGGVTTVIDMPLSGCPAVISPEALMMKKRAGELRARVDYSLWGGLVNDNVGDMGTMFQVGAVAFKAFTCFAGDDFPYATPDVLYRGMKEARRLGALIGVHCEDQGLTSRLCINEAERGTVRSFLEAHSPLAELLATRAVIEMAVETGARVHICHATIPEAVDAVSQAREAGADVTVETCPHYLVFSEDDLEGMGPVLKCAPPVRRRDAVEAMWKRVIDGTIDSIGSDHSPSTPQQKDISGGKKFADAWGGVQGIQTMLPVMFYEGTVKRGLPLERLVDLISTTPARLFSLYPKKGAIQPGSDADFVIFDPEARWTVTPEWLLHKNRHTPYMGMQLQGRVETTILRGRVAYSDSRVRDIRGRFQTGRFQGYGRAGC